MRYDCPTGYFVEGNAIWGDPGRGAVFSRIWDFQCPDLNASDDKAAVSLEEKLRLIVAGLDINERLQLHYYTSSNFGAALDRYAEIKPDIEICSKVRDELVRRYRQRMADETLIQGNLRLSLSTKMPAFLKEDGKTVRGFQGVFKVLSRAFDHKADFWRALLTNSGGSVEALDNQGHYDELVRFWSPTQARFPRIPSPDWLRPIDQLCRFSGLSPRTEPNRGFYLDGYYFGILVAKTLPRQTWAQIMDAFTAMAIPNVRVVVNMQPVNIDAEIRHEEERYGKLNTNIDPKNPSLVSIVGMQTHQERMTNLISGKTIPFKAQLIVIACEKTPEALDAHIAALRAALEKTTCEAWQPSLWTSEIALFNAATPGFGPWLAYRDFWHRADDAVNVADLWPASSTPRADLDCADWITDGDMDNLIGGTCFTGGQPNHGLDCGSTGYGKSLNRQALTLQTAHLFKFIAVIDDGLSWMTTCHKLDPTSRPIIVRADGNLTFNIFDTRGLPLSAQHLASATALCHLLVGVSSDEDKDKLRDALLAEAISTLYDSAFKTWQNANPERYYDLSIQTARILRFQQAEAIETFLDAFLEYRESNEEVEPDESHFVKSLAFATWTPEMFPTLSDLEDELRTMAFEKGPHQELYATLATLLQPWLRGGLHGQLVDGVGNIDLGSVRVTENTPLKVVHFELERISKADSVLRAVVGFLITNEVRNHIQGMPRGIRKQFIIEEMISFLKVPNGAEIVLDCYERMRKYLCQVISIFQSYSTLLEANEKVAKAIVSQSSVMFLLGNHNRSDLDTLSKYLPQPMPEVVKDRICSFPKPSKLPRDKAYCGYVYVQLSGEQVKYTVGRTYVSHEVERIASSSGSDFDRKRMELRNAQHTQKLNVGGNGELPGSLRLPKTNDEPYGERRVGAFERQP